MRKLLALILALTMVVGLATVAPLAVNAEGVETIQTDVVAEAAELLMTLNILQGYSDGTLGLEQNITRAEFATMISRMLQGTDELNLNAGAIVHSKMSEHPDNIAALERAKAPGSSLATAGIGRYQTDIDSSDLADPSFTDLDPYHWAYNDVEYLRELGIVTGYSDGTFRPDNNILFEEAVKFTVSALGQDFKAVTYGGYPNGYIRTANSLKILKNVLCTEGVAITRRDIAVLLFNALTAEFLVIDGLDEGYNIYGTGKNILSYVYGMDIIEDCYVTATDETGIYSINDATDKGVLEINDSVKLAYYNESYKDLIGYQVKAYVKFDDMGVADGEVYCMFPYYKTKSIKVNAKDIKRSDIEGNIFEAYVGDDAKEFKIHDFPTVLYNGYALGVVADYDRYITGDRGIETGNVTLVSTTGKNVYDLIMINNYIPMYVENVKLDEMTVTGSMFYGGSLHEDKELDLDFEDRDKEISLRVLREDGSIGSFYEISTDAVIYVRTAIDGKHHIITTTNAIAQGTITRKGAGFVVFDYAKYEEVEDSGILSDFKAGQYVLLGLTIDGEVFYAEADAGLGALSYGLLMDINIDNSNKFEPLFELKIMDDSGTKHYLKAAEGMKFTYDGITKRYNYETAKGIEAEEISDKLLETATHASLQAAVNSKTGADYTQNSAFRPYEQIIKYSTDANGNVNHLMTAMSSRGLTPEEKANHFTYEEVNLNEEPYTWGNGIIKATPYVVQGVKLFRVSISEEPEDSDYKVDTWGTGDRHYSNGIVLFDVSASGKPAVGITRNDSSKFSRSESTMRDFYVVEYFNNDETVEIEGEIENAFGIGFIADGSYKEMKSYGEVLNDDKYGYGHTRITENYNIGDVVNPTWWVTGNLYDKHYIITSINVNGELSFDGVDMTVAWGYFPIKSMISRIMDGSWDKQFRMSYEETSYRAPYEVVFGKVRAVEDGRVIVSYGELDQEAIGCEITSKKAARYDCSTGYVSVVDASSVEKGDWVLLQLKDSAFATMVIYTNTEDASIDNVKIGLEDGEENKRD